MTVLHRFDRRRLLQTAGASALLAAPAIRAFAQGRSPADPFTLGVASGYPTPDGFVLWTRLAPDPLNGGGMPPQRVPITWEVATDEGMSRVVLRGEETADPVYAHSVHVEVAGLEPGRWYWYRFHALGAASPVGRTRSAPAAGAPLDRFTFAFASCQQYEHGFYTAYRHMAQEDLDLVVHLGDYIYEATWGKDLVRSHGAPTCTTLADYRNRYALYKGDMDLQRVHASFPWLSTWDDHEVENDYANDRSVKLTPPEEFRARRAAAYQAYYEHMPLPHRMRPRGPDMRIYERAVFGDLVRFHVLDDRQYRSPQPCPRDDRGGGRMVDEHCAARLDPASTMLGAAQEKWLDEGLSLGGARWTVIAQQTIMAQIDRKPGPDVRYWTDYWDGYAAPRQRLLDSIITRRLANPLVIGGDVHAYWVTDLKADPERPESPTIATEFVGTSITSQATPQARFDAMRADNPHVRFVDSAHRGYVRMALTSRGCMADLRAVDTVRAQESAIRTLASFAVEDGKPGAVKA